MSLRPFLRPVEWRRAKFPRKALCFRSAALEKEKSKATPSFLRGVPSQGNQRQLTLKSVDVLVKSKC